MKSKFLFLIIFIIVVFGSANSLYVFIGQTGFKIIELLATKIGSDLEVKFVRMDGIYCPDNDPKYEKKANFKDAEIRLDIYRGYLKDKNFSYNNGSIINSTNFKKNIGCRLIITYWYNKYALGGIKCYSARIVDTFGYGGSIETTIDLVPYIKDSERSMLKLIIRFESNTILETEIKLVTMLITSTGVLAVHDEGDNDIYYEYFQLRDDGVIYSGHSLDHGYYTASVSKVNDNKRNNTSLSYQVSEFLDDNRVVSLESINSSNKGSLYLAPSSFFRLVSF